ncbi:hypothetical protein NMY22_g860 [Coprinellus aureogranulatus]|nr:hypothetical protein NMY22_g860 [Coprinellus aureogranulatus]
MGQAPSSAELAGAGEKFAELPEDVAEDALRPRYALISKQVQRWVEPLIYRDVVVDLKRRLFHRTITSRVSTKPPDFFALHVKGLFMRIYDSYQSDQDAARILQKCHSLQSLTIWSYVYAGELVRIQRVLRTPPFSPTQMSLYKFFITPDVTTSRSFYHPIFSSITHLDVTCKEDEGEWDWPSLRNLRKLTHLSVDAYVRHRDPGQLAHDILRHCPRGLRVLVFSLTHCCLPGHLRSLQSLVEGIIDSRAVVVHLGTRLLPGSLEANFEMTSNDLTDDWGYPSMGSKLWSRAEQVVKARQRAEEKSRTPAA